MTLDLIATNVYNSVKAPTKRGFSYIEIWMIGVQIPILLGIFEYAILLTLKKYWQGKVKKAVIISSEGSVKGIPNNDNKSNWEDLERRIDKCTFVSALLFIIIFNVVYWFFALVLK